MKKKFLFPLLLAVLLFTACGALPTAPSAYEGAEEQLPAYAGDAYIEVNGNIPFFTTEELTDVSYEYYSELDALGRCGVCIASIGTDIMPAEERGSIGNVKPTGWHTVKYAGLVDGNYLYNRCHLIGYQLTGENANTQNLITGTRYLNIQGMQPFENRIADYVKETGNHVMYRVTPVFEGDNLLASGVFLEGRSVEDDGEGILFHVYCYNVQPGIIIDYASGDSAAAPAQAAEPKAEPETGQQSDGSTGAYAVNGNNGKIHMVGACAATGTDAGAMKNPVYFDTYGEAEAYSVSIAPGLEKRRCGNCW